MKKNSMKPAVLPLVLAAAFFVFTAPLCAAAENGAGKTLILYYSLTGNTRAGCEALQKALQADIIEIRDRTNRSGRWGFVRSAFGSLLGLHTAIEPEHPDMTAYGTIILGSPVWTGKLSMAVRTLIDKNSFDGKRVIVYTTTNAYEQEKHKEKSRNLVRKKGGTVAGYYQVLAREEKNGEKVARSREQIVVDTLEMVPEIRTLLSAE